MFEKPCLSGCKKDSIIAPWPMPLIEKAILAGVLARRAGSDVSLTAHIK